MILARTPIYIIYIHFVYYINIYISEVYIYLWVHCVSLCVRRSFFISARGVSARWTARISSKIKRKASINQDSPKAPWLFLINTNKYTRQSGVQQETHTSWIPSQQKAARCSEGPVLSKKYDTNAHVGHQKQRTIFCSEKTFYLADLLWELIKSIWKIYCSLKSIQQHRNKKYSSSSQGCGAWVGDFHHLFEALCRLTTRYRQTGSFQVFSSNVWRSCFIRLCIYFLAHPFLGGHGWRKPGEWWNTG